MDSDQIKVIDSHYSDYLADESRRSGHGDTISFPRTEAEVVEVVKWAYSGNIPLTVQSGRTGITAGAVPEQGGHILNLSRMNRVTGASAVSGRFSLALQPGVLLSDLRRSVHSSDYDVTGWSDESLQVLALMKGSDELFFPPDPTETSAGIGGMAACNASGACSFLYGPVRRYICGLRLVLSNGDVISVRRGECCASGNYFELQSEGGGIYSGELPGYVMPSVKSAAGYFVEPDMDLIDLFIGSEGTLGVITQVEVELITKPASVWGMMTYWPDEESAVRFVEAVSAMEERPAAVELFDSRALELLRQSKNKGGVFEALPVIESAWHTGIYVELHAGSDEAAESLVELITEIMDQCGGNIDDTWLATEAAELERLKHFRHALPEAVNMIIDQRRRAVSGLTKLGTDLAVPAGELRNVLNMYRRDLDENHLEYVIFGHIGDNHVHVNILPRDMDDYERGRSLYLKWAQIVVKCGGTVSAEHGIGKLKRDLLALMYGESAIEEMRALKALFDPGWLLSCGNLFER